MIDETIPVLFWTEYEGRVSACIGNLTRRVGKLYAVPQLRPDDSSGLTIHSLILLDEGNLELQQDTGAGRPLYFHRGRIPLPQKET